MNTLYKNFKVLNNSTVTQYFNEPMQYYINLTAPSIFSLISPQDEFMLFSLAKSSKSIKKKLREIDEIMKKYCYFKKIGVGTNRVIYKNLNLDHHVLKVAFDNTALQDGPREIVNQKYAAPICTKIFEVSPNNVITSAECVIPIKTYEEFGLYYEEIYSIIIDKFVANGLLFDDIGFSFYKNWGLRFGSPVLLDFPYLYKFNDMEQLRCHNNVHGMPCGGFLELDCMVNYLYCPSCGKQEIPLDSTGLKLNNEPMIALNDSHIITEGSIFVPKIKLFVDGKLVNNNSVSLETEYIENLNKNNTSSIEEILELDDEF